MQSIINRASGVEMVLLSKHFVFVSGGVAREVKYVVVDSDTDRVDFGFVWADGGDHAGIGDLAVG